MCMRSGSDVLTTPNASSGVPVSHVLHSSSVVSSTGLRSWLIVQALKLGNEEQKEFLLHAYGSKAEPNYVEKVKAVYETMDLKRIFRKYEVNAYRTLKMKIDRLTEEDRRLKELRRLFHVLLDSIYMRKK